MKIGWPAGAFVLLMLPAAQACHRAAYRYQPPPATSAATNGTSADAGPQLVFMSFNMTTSAAGAHQLAPLLMKVVPGAINAVAEEDVRAPSYLLVTQLTADGQPCGPPRRVAHPLVQDVEAPTASGALQRQLALVPQAEFFIRLIRLPQARAVRLEEVGPAAPQPISTTFPLPN